MLTQAPSWLEWPNIRNIQDPSFSSDSLSYFQQALPIDQAFIRGDISLFEYEEALNEVKKAADREIEAGEYLSALYGDWN